MKLFSELGSLIFQKRCALCRAENIAMKNELEICVQCSSNLAVRRNIVNRGSLRIFAGSEFSPAISHIILATKEDDNSFARAILAEYLTMALELARTKDKICLIPIPSRKAANRARGFAHTIKLIEAFSEKKSGKEFVIIDCLIHSRKVRDQSTLNINERELNMRGAFEIERSALNRLSEVIISEIPIFLLDDLVTTGSTVLAAKSALKTRGIGVNGVLTSCATNGFTH